MTRRNSRRRISRSRKSSKKETHTDPYRASTSSSDLEKGLHISGSDTDGSDSTPDGLYHYQTASPIAESPTFSDRLTMTADSKSYQSFGSYTSTRTPRPGSFRPQLSRPSLGSSSVYSSARSKVSKSSSATSLTTSRNH